MNFSYKNLYNFYFNITEQYVTISSSLEKIHKLLLVNMYCYVQKVTEIV